MCVIENLWHFVMILRFQTDRSVQTEDPDETAQSDHGLHCLPFCLHLLDSLFYGKTMLFKY